MKSKALQLVCGLAAVSLLAFAGCSKDDDEGDKTVPVTSVSITEGSALGLVVGDARTLHATVKPDNATEKTVTWSSNAPAVVAVNSSTGVIEALAVGNATVTASAGGKSVAIQLAVAPAPIPLTGLAINPAGPLTLKVGDEQTLSAVLTPEDATDVTVVGAAPTRMSCR